MRFVDQGWKQVDLHPPPPEAARPDASHGAHTFERLAVPQQPSLHVFTPRLRNLVQCARLEQRQTVAALAKQIDVSADDLIAIEEGRQFPSTRTIAALQRVLCVQLIPEMSRPGASVEG